MIAVAEIESGQERHVPDNQTQRSVRDVQARQAEICDVAQFASVVNLACASNKKVAKSVVISSAEAVIQQAQPRLEGPPPPPKCKTFQASRLTLVRPSRDPKYGKTGCYTPVSLPVLLQESKNGNRHLAGCQLAVTKGLASEHPSGLPPIGCPEFEEGDNWSCRERTRQSTSTQPKADPGDLWRGKNVTLRRVTLIA